jgi:hypothetical protein
MVALSSFVTWHDVGCGSANKEATFRVTRGAALLLLYTGLSRPTNDCKLDCQMRVILKLRYTQGPMYIIRYGSTKLFSSYGMMAAQLYMA